MVFHKDLVSATVQRRPVAEPPRHGHGRRSAPIVFCLLAGAVYTINDLVDVEADRVHPVKRNRPIASGRRPGELRLAVHDRARRASRSASRRSSLNWMFAAVAALYFVENIAYSFKLKKVAFLDVGLIAFGFVLRVYAGGLATDTQGQLVHARLHGAARAVPRLRQAPPRARGRACGQAARGARGLFQGLAHGGARDHRASPPRPRTSRTRSTRRPRRSSRRATCG